MSPSKDFLRYERLILASPGELHEAWSSRRRRIVTGPNAETRPTVAGYGKSGKRAAETQ